MKLHRLLILGLLAAGVLNASGMTLDIGGPLTASAGATTGWGFTLMWTSTNEWASVTQSTLFNETNPLLGIYTDIIGPEGGPDQGAIDPSSPAWTQTYDAVNSLGLGSYTIDPAAAPFAADSGQIVVDYDVFDGPPSSTGNYLRSESVTANFTVQVAPAPEPASLWLAAFGGAVAWGFRRKALTPRSLPLMASRRCSTNGRAMPWRS